MSDIKNPFSDLKKLEAFEEEIEEVEVGEKKDYPLVPAGYHKVKIESIEVREAKEKKLPYLLFKFRLENNRVLFKRYFPYHSKGSRKSFEYALRNIGFTRDQRAQFDPTKHLKPLFGFEVSINVKHVDDKFFGKVVEDVMIAPDRYVDRDELTRRLTEAASETDEEFPEE